MAGLVDNIFGITQRQYEEEKKQGLQDLAMKLSSSGNISADRAMLGATIGDYLGNKLGVAMGGTDPRQEARDNTAKMEALNKSLENIAPGDSRRFYLLSDAYQSVGDSATAAKYILQGQQMDALKEARGEAKAKDAATKAEEIEKRKALAAGYVDKTAKKMAMEGFSPTEIEKVIKSKERKASIPTPTKEDIGQVSSILSMNEIDFGEETQPVVVSMIAEELSRLKTEYQKGYEEGDFEKSWLGDTPAIDAIIRNLLREGRIVKEPSTFGFGGGWKFNPAGSEQGQQPKQQQSAVEATFPGGVPIYPGPGGDNVPGEDNPVPGKDNYKNQTLFEAIQNAGNTK